MVLFPGAVLPLRVFEPRYRQMIQDLLDLGPNGRPNIRDTQPSPRDATADARPGEFGVVAIRQGWEVGADAASALHGVGCTAQIRQIDANSDGTIGLVTVGRRRFTLGAVDRSRSYLRARVSWLDDPIGDPDAVAVLARSVARSFGTYLTAMAENGQVDAEKPEFPDDPTRLSHLVGAAAPLDLDDRQSLLRAPDVECRLRLASTVLARETTMLRRVRAVPVGLSELQTDQCAN